MDEIRSWYFYYMGDIAKISKLEHTHRWVQVALKKNGTWSHGRPTSKCALSSKGWEACWKSLPKAIATSDSNKTACITTELTWKKKRRSCGALTIRNNVKGIVLILECFKNTHQLSNRSFNSVVNFVLVFPFGEVLKIIGAKVVWSQVEHFTHAWSLDESRIDIRLRQPSLLSLWGRLIGTRSDWEDKNTVLYIGWPP